MDPDLERTRRGLQEAAEFAGRYRFEITAEYLALIEQIEALPQNQSGADKSGRWMGSRADANAWRARVTRTPERK
jgi:hypothetical protein